MLHEQHDALPADCSDSADLLEAPVALDWACVMKTTDERTSPSAPLGEKVTQPVQPQKTVEQWVTTGTPGYVRSSTTGSIKPITPGSPT